MSSLTVTLIQADLVWEDKAANLAKFEEKINALKDAAGLVILPEMFSTGFSMKAEELAEDMDGIAVNWMKTMAAKKKIILTGSLIIKDGDAYYNRLIWMLPNGQYGYYDKRHLFGLGSEDEHYSPGNKRLIASANGWKINLQVCYDLRFPTWARNQVTMKDDVAEPEYDVLIYVANWPERRSHHWKSLLIARAIENQCYVIGVNRVGTDGPGLYHSGDSMIVDPLGQVVYTKANEEDVFTYTLDKAQLDDVRTRLPFWKDGDRFILQ